MSKEPNMETVARALGVTVQHQEQELIHLRRAMACAARQMEERLYMAAHQTIVTALGGRDE